MGIKAGIIQLLEKKFTKQYRLEIEKQHLDYSTWIRVKEKELAKKLEDKDISKAPEYFLLPTQSGRYVDIANKAFSYYFKSYPECQIVYADEDVMDENSGQRSHPIFKPSWSPDLFLNHNYLGNVVAIRKTFLEEVGISEEDFKVRERDEILKECLTFCDGFKQKKEVQKIGHIPFVLFSSTKEKLVQKKIQLEDVSLSEKVISIVILSKDNPDLLYECMQSIEKTKGELLLEMIVVDNGSGEENKEKVEGLKSNFDFQYIYNTMEFNFSTMCNLGAKEASGDYLLFLNDDIKAVEDGWLEVLAKKAAKEYVGAVGIQLRYPESGQIQHAGVVNLPMGPVHKLQFLDPCSECYLDRNRGIHNVIAVTAAALMIEKAKFIEIGGFDEQFKVAFNDIDFCYRLYEKGYYNVVINTNYLLHYESFSRGDDESVAKAKRLQQELKLLNARHPKLKGKDPFYSRNLNHKALDTRILLGCEESCIEYHDTMARVIENEPSFERMDECLIVRLEHIEYPILRGYAVVLGANNARYCKSLILKRVESGIKDSYGYQVELPGYYRSDLEDGMKEQQNVGLCGFSIRICEPLKAGEYEIGVLVKDKLNKKKIMNFSSRRLIIEK